MLRTRLYYNAKPYLPYRVRLALRRWHARGVLRECGDVWPIMPGSEKPPAGWHGWPAHRQFGVVLTHDVESRQGLERIKQLAELEMTLGFRSSFNFIPEGGYHVPSALRSWLVENGFEVGVHDLRHDGKLYRSWEEFRRNADRINHYLREWGAVGFRSGFMLHKLDWLHDLDIEYDASTFDTDPFEPQPQGVGTIFPFWVPRPEDGGQRSEVRDQRTHNGEPRSKGGDQRAALTSDIRPLTSGYVELPYTLIQDFNLFVVLGAQTADFWRRKIEWLAARGGMVHLDTHPDFMSFGPSAPRKGYEFCVERYRETLEWLRDTYSGQYWHGLPREAAALARPTEGTEAVRLDHRSCSVHVGRGGLGDIRGCKIWIDLDNTPHVPFFCPIIKELELRGHRVVITTRDAFQVCEMADLKGLAHRRIGRHYGRNKIAKVLGLFYRAAQLCPFARKEKPDLAVSHGARSQIIASNLLGIPTVLIADYEFAQAPPLMRPQWEIVPEAIPVASCHARADRVLHYPGIKEDVYAWTLEPDASVLDELGIRNGDVVVVVRPPATEAHYHNPESEILFAAVMNRLLRHAHTKVVLLPRNQKQTAWTKSNWPQWFASDRVVIPPHALDGMNLLWHADLVVSGGGTMNREAAALGVPVYSIFRGPIGAVDTKLAAEGRLTLISSVGQIDSGISVTRRDRTTSVQNRPAAALRAILDHIEGLLPLRPGHLTRS